MLLTCIEHGPFEFTVSGSEATICCPQCQRVVFEPPGHFPCGALPIPAGAIKDGVLHLSLLEPGIYELGGGFLDSRGVGLSEVRRAAAEGGGGDGREELPTMRATTSDGSPLQLRPDGQDVLQTKLRELEGLIFDYGRAREQRGGLMGGTHSVNKTYRAVRDALRELGLNDDGDGA